MERTVIIAVFNAMQRRHNGADQRAFVVVRLYHVFSFLFDQCGADEQVRRLQKVSAFVSRIAPSVCRLTLAGRLFAALSTRQLALRREVCGLVAVSTAMRRSGNATFLLAVDGDQSLSWLLADHKTHVLSADGQHQSTKDEALTVEGREMGLLVADRA
jgi:hypothetical protein